MPRGGVGSRVIHPRWSPRARVPAESVMTATVKITRPDKHTTPVFDEVSGSQTTPDPYVVASSLEARISVARQVSDLNVRNVGEQKINIRRYLVQIPLSWTDVQIGDVITVLTNPDDPKIVGREYSVMDLQGESLSWSRVLRCEVYQS